MMKRMLCSLIIVVFSLGAFASDSESISIKLKPFARWKEHQVVDAQNKVVRLSNLLLLLKSERYLPENILPQVAKENKQEINIPENQQQELVKITEAQLSKAIASLEFVKELTLKDYISVYLQQYKNEPQALEALATEMNKQEIAQILLSLINTQKVGIATPAPLQETAQTEKRVPSKL